MDYDNEEEFIHDVDATIEALRECWKCVPHMSLGELIDSVTSSPIFDLDENELLSELNEFAHQNKRS